MVSHKGDVFSNRVLHYATGLRWTRQYWFKQCSRLIAMVDTLGLPTIFFTHSAADLQWPELAHLICPDDHDSSSSRSTALLENPTIADWFFHHRIQKFVDTFFVNILGATDFWFHFSGSIVVVLMCMALPGFPMRLTWSRSWPPQMPAPTQQGRLSSSMLTGLSAPSIQQLCLMEATLMKLHHRRPIHTSAISPTLRLRTSTKTWLTLLPRASATPTAQLPTACGLAMASRSVALATQSLYSLRQPSSQKMESQNC